MTLLMKSQIIQYKNKQSHSIIIAVN